MNNIKQQQKNLIKIMQLLPKHITNKALEKEWNNKTKPLNQLPNQENQQQIKKQITPQTKKTNYQNKTTHEWLTELTKLKNTDTLTTNQKQFIKWYKTEYPQISIKQILQEK
jgi:hypothetical protein